MVGGLPPMGCLPIQMTAKFRNALRFCLEQENRDSVLYNQKLQNLLPQIEASLTGSKILYSNVYDPMMDMMQNPSKYGIDDTISFLFGKVSYEINIDQWLYMFIDVETKTGFKETKRGCCGTGHLETSFMCNAFSPTCRNHSEFLFFDSIHPSEATYNYMGNFLDTQIRVWLEA